MRARAAAEKVFAQVAAGQSGCNLAQGFKHRSPGAIDQTEHGFVVNCHGITTRPHRSETGAIIHWAHLASTALPARLPRERTV